MSLKEAGKCLSYLRTLFVGVLLPPPPCCLYPVAMGACDRDALQPSAAYFCPPKQLSKLSASPPVCPQQCQPPEQLHPCLLPFLPQALRQPAALEML